MPDKNHPEYQYLNILQDILDNGVKQVDKGTGDVTYSVFGRQIRFDLKDSFPVLTTKKVFFKTLLHELYWFLSGQTNIKYLVDNKVPIWNDYPYRIYREKIEAGLEPELTKEEFIAKIAADPVYAEKYGNLPRIYGEMWRKWPTKDGRTIDQVRWVVDTLKKDPDAHNAIVTAWNPEYLYEMAKKEDACRFPICHTLWQCNVKNGRLSLQLYQRSCDAFLGVPFNIASYSLLALILARATGNEPGEFIHTYGDIHIYENHIDQVKEQLTREPRPFPTVTLSPECTDIDNFKPEHITLNNYDPHPPIRAEMAVVGGIVTDDWKKFVQDKKKSETNSNS